MAIADERHVCKGCRFLCVDAGQSALHSALYAVRVRPALAPVNKCPGYDYLWVFIAGVSCLL